MKGSPGIKTGAFDGKEVFNGVSQRKRTNNKTIMSKRF